MEANFDKNFESHKALFKSKFGIDWNSNPQLYLGYLNTIYTAALTEITNNAFRHVIENQEYTKKLLQGILQKIK